MKQNILTQIHTLLVKNQQTIAAAESCTGGMLAEMLTRNSGSSKYFLLGIVSYSNKAKIKILRVPESIILKKSAVSEETCRKMAKSIRIMAGSDFGIGITGIAGPTGATPLKPVGTVFIAIDSKNKKLCQKFNFKGNRDEIRKQASLEALELLKRLL